jgi:hypothetical protein
MINIIRVYTSHGECYREPRDIIRILSESLEPVELDWADGRGWVKMAKSSDFSGQSVMIEEVPFEMPAYPGAAESE